MSRRSTRQQRRSKRINTPSQADVEFEERKCFDYRDSCFKGSALVHIRDLDFGKCNNRFMDDGNKITRLAQILNIQGCLRLDRQFHVPVVVDAADWCSNVIPEEPTLVPGLGMKQLETSEDYTLVALDHENIIVAARQKFKELEIEDPWWVADIYVIRANNDLALRDELVRSLQESFPNDQRPSDGKIYQKIRYYQGCLTGVRNRTAEQYWWALLESEPGSRKGDYLRGLSESFQIAFDALLPITGIWAGMSIGVLHKLKAMKCDEPIICYLEHIRSTFYRLVDGNEEVMSHIDAASIKIMKSKVPKISWNDLNDLESEKENKTLFPFLDDHQRNLIWERLKDTDFPIPTLETFFQDILYLDVGQCVMRRLCLEPPKGKNTIDKVLKSQYLDFFSSYWEQTVQNDQLHDLWRFGFQYAFELTTKRDHHRRVPRKNKHKERELSMDTSEEINGLSQLLLLRQLFSLARDYGFVVPVRESDQLSEVGELPRPLPCDFPPDDEEDVEIERRCGKPFTDSVHADRFALSRESLRQNGESRRVSAGFVRRSVFRAFFSYLNASVAESPQSNPSRESSDENDFRVESNELTFLSSTWNNTASFSPSFTEEFGPLSASMLDNLAHRDSSPSALHLA